MFGDGCVELNIQEVETRKRASILEVYVPSIESSLASKTTHVEEVESQSAQEAQSQFHQLRIRHQMIVTLVCKSSSCCNFLAG